MFPSKSINLYFFFFLGQGHLNDLSSSDINECIQLNICICIKLFKSFYGNATQICCLNSNILNGKFTVCQSNVKTMQEKNYSYINN